MTWAAAELPDPFNPLGCKGIGEPTVGAGSGAVLCAIADALGGQYFYRTPITPEMVLTELEQLPQAHDRLMTHV